MKIFHTKKLVCGPIITCSPNANYCSRLKNKLLPHTKSKEKYAIMVVHLLFNQTQLHGNNGIDEEPYKVITTCSTFTHTHTQT